jgi:peptide/nickel transport system permease protein
VIAYLLRRVLYAVPIALAVSFICFMLVHIAPGEAISAIVPPDAPPDVIEQVKVEYGLDKPIIVQFWVWLEHVVHGDFGRSLSTGRQVTTEIGSAIGNTVSLALVAAVPAFLLACIIGGLAAFRPGGWMDHLASGAAITAVSTPHYWLGIVLVIVFSVLMNWLPAMGAGPGSGGPWQFDWAHLRFFILPAITLAIIPVGIVIRTVRGVVGEILNQEFIVTLQAKGLQRRTVLLHVIKNAAPTTLTVIGLQFGHMVGGSIMVETVFAWPGTGFLLNNAIFQRDIPILQGTVLVLSLFFVTLNLTVDLLQTLLDPRIRRTPRT